MTSSDDTPKAVRTAKPPEGPNRLDKIQHARAALSEAGELVTGLPFGHEIGMRLHQAEAGVAVLSVPYDARLIGDPETGVLHGGVITTATLDLRIDYMRPATAGEAVFSRAECYRLTRSVGFARAVAYHTDPQDPVATAQGAFMLERTAKEGGVE
jgi:acyl-coenzyme A thioesterase PaaI-like protein